MFKIIYKFINDIMIKDTVIKIRKKTAIKLKKMKKYELETYNEIIERLIYFWEDKNKSD